MTPVAGSSNQANHTHVRDGTIVGFLTDPTICIGCKACEVACKLWNDVPLDSLAFLDMSYDNTGSLGASTWRHVKFLELDPSLVRAGGPPPLSEAEPPHWLFFSDVCKHCANAGCLEACPTGAIVRTEVGSVYVQDDVCNGCGYCIVTCPFGVIDRRPEPLPGAGGAFKCTFCYDRQIDGLPPACAKVCPTEAIQFGPLDELRARAAERVEQLRARGFSHSRVYDPVASSVGGTHAVFVLLGEPEPLGLPANPEVPTVRLGGAWLSALVTAAAALAGSMLAFRLFE